MHNSKDYLQKIKFKAEKLTLTYKFDNQDFNINIKEVSHNSTISNWLFKYVLIEVHNAEFGQTELDLIWKEICLHHPLAGYETQKIAIINKTSKPSFIINEMMVLDKPTKEIPVKQFNKESEAKEWFEFEEIFELKRKMALSNLMLF